MKRATLRRAVLGALLMMGCGALSADTITVVADPWCPYNCEPGSDQPGYMIEVAQRVFAEAGHVVEYVEQPWSRAVVEAKLGRYDAIVGASKRDSRGLVYPEAELGVSSNVFLVRADSAWRYGGLGSLDKVTLGAVGGYTYSAALDGYIQQYKRTSARVRLAFGDGAMDEQIEALVAGAIGTYVDDRNVLNHALVGTGRQAAFKEAGELGRDPLYMAFSGKHPKAQEYARLLSEGVARLRASGELAKILAKYGLKDWQS